MASTRILVLPRPRILREILEEVVAGTPGCELVGDGEADGDLTAAAREHDASFVVVGGGDADRDAIDALLAARPSTKVLALDADGRGVELFELQPHRVPLGEASPERLMAVIREHAAAGGGS